MGRRLFLAEPSAEWPTAPRLTQTPSPCHSGILLLLLQRRRRSECSAVGAEGCRRGHRGPQPCRRGKGGARRKPERAAGRREGGKPRGTWRGVISCSHLDIRVELAKRIRFLVLGAFSKPAGSGPATPRRRCKPVGLGRATPRRQGSGRARREFGRQHC